MYDVAYSNYKWFVTLAAAEHTNSIAHVHFSSMFGGDVPEKSFVKIIAYLFKRMKPAQKGMSSINSNQELIGRVGFPD